ncbi:ribose transport system permease protein [Kribbella aluminosa]|uniref:Autoinducer 2 import system permease protein LsrD n=1 Tax=Kribbella aluminosa TaxID=416017 RepID=A0ABS4UX00_9ACTN|nr:ABC transporter permease [Kribbella aluminosa]MBP2356049.1 ribose transport system permease protein [Kribbella aluminosa]
MRRFARSTEMTLLAICVVFFVALVIASDGELLAANSLRVLLQFLAVPVLIGLAQMVVLAVGQLNLAVGAIGGFAAAAMAVLMADHGVPAPFALLIGFLLAAVAGLVNGVLVVLTRINGFIVTLATMTVLIGVQYRMVGTRTVDAYPQALKIFGSSALFGVVPWIFIVALIVAGGLSVLLRRTVPGRKLLASGGNPIAARLSGISNDRSVIVAHTLSGAVLGVAAILTVASSPGVNKSIGGDWLLPSFAAPIIGGALLTGGSAVVLGTVLAAFIVRFVDTARAEFSLEPSWVNFVVGAVVLGSVVLGQVRTRRQQRRTVVKSPDVTVAGGVS